MYKQSLNFEENQIALISDMYIDIVDNRQNKHIK
jgi:hypothetical protein